jgi:hypothetical protein
MFDYSRPELYRKQPIKPILLLGHRESAGFDYHTKRFLGESANMAVDYIVVRPQQKERWYGN